MARAKKRGLGKGLGALISSPIDDLTEDIKGAAGESGDSGLLSLDPHALEPNPHQPRTDFDEEALEELASSIANDGIIEPIIVRKNDERYEIVSGERRVRAAIMAGLEAVPVICREISDNDMLRLGLIENIQREDLNPIETAQAYNQLLEEFEWTQEELARQVGKKRATVTNTLRLLKLHEEVQDKVRDGSISMGHARAILALERPEDQVRLCRKVITQELSVRQTEKLTSPSQAESPKEPKQKDPEVVAIENELRRYLGTKVWLKTGKGNRGKIEIEYFDLDELDRLLDYLRQR